MVRYGKIMFEKILWAIFMAFLSIRELEEKDKERARVNHQTYKQIYEACASQIRRQHGTGNTSLLYTIPAFIVGRTPYTHSHAIRYTIEKLERGGFHVLHSDETPGIIYVDWSKRPAPAKKTSTSKSKLKSKSKSKSKSKPTPKKIDEPLSVRIARLQAKSIMDA